MNQQRWRVSCGARFELIVDPPWTVYRHVDASGTAWDVARHAGIREEGVAIWQVFAHRDRHSIVLTSRFGDDVGPLFHCNVRDLTAMLRATAEYIQLHDR